MGTTRRMAGCIAVGSAALRGCLGALVALRRVPGLRVAAAVVMLLAALVAAPAARASVILPPGSIPIPSTGTFLYMNSQAGDWVGGGTEQLYTAANSSFNASLPQGSGYFQAFVNQDSYTHWWDVDIAAPTGQPLAVGSYTGAMRAAFRPANTPGLDVGGDGRGCNTLTGQFDVNELTYGPTGALLVFDATFEQHCEGGAPALYGRIRIDSGPLPARTLTLSATVGGTASAAPPGPTYDAGTMVTLTATPDPGYIFTGWTVDGAAAPASSPFSLTMNADHTVVATFAPARSLTLTATVGGMATASPPRPAYPQGMAVTLTAAPNAGYAFAGWTVDGAPAGSANPYTLTMDADHTVVATFAPARSLTLSATAGGTVAASPPGPAYPQGTAVTLTATPAPGHVFIGWTVDGASAGNANPYGLTMDADHTVTATFAPITHTLALTATAGGTAAASPAGPRYPQGTVVTLTATPNADYVFAGWTVDGVPAGTATPFSLTMDADYTAVAAFTPIMHTLTLSATAGGRASASPPGPAYRQGTAVTLTATANTGYAFTGWSVDGVSVGTANPYHLTMGADHAVVATFAPTRWSPWASQGGILTDSPAAASLGDRVYVFARGSDNALYVTSTADGTTWSDWTRLGGVLTAAPAATSFDGALYVFAKGSDGALYAMSSADGATWSTWTRLGGILTAPPAAASANGRLYVFAKGSDSALYVTSSADGATYTSWRDLGGVLTAAPAAAGFRDQIYVFARGSDDALYETHSTDGVTFAGWRGFGGVLTAAPAAASFTPAGGAETLYTFATGTDQALYERSMTDGANWTAWQSLGGLVVGPPAAAGAGGDLYVFARWGDNALWARYLHP